MLKTPPVAVQSDPPDLDHNHFRTAWPWQAWQSAQPGERGCLFLFGEDVLPFEINPPLEIDGIASKTVAADHSFGLGQLIVRDFID
ncbi:hypothetical protein [Desulfosarcina sp.]|uniref:hypothetical protein n=1 Tax=Desulfosarcina sp. TaxID=2027861 RepID=UPI003566A6C5